VPHYRIPFFAQLKKLGLESNVEYVVGAENCDINRLKEIGYKSSLQIEAIAATKYTLKGRLLLKHNIPRYLLTADLIIAEFALRNLVVFKWAYLGGAKRLALWGHGRTYTKANTKFEEWVKTKLVNHCDWFFGYTQNGVDSVVEKGFQSNFTTVVQNSTDTNELKELLRIVTDKMIDDFKLRNSVGDGPVAVFVGSLDASKRLEFLIASAILVHKKIPDFELLIFGSGPELEKVLASCGEFPFIKYCGTADQSTQALISKVAKLIMMPGRVGLIAVDSFALGLPIATTKWPWHAPEFEYLSNGRNSLISNDTLEDYSLGVVNLIRDEFKISELRNNCLKDSKIYTIETMAFNFHEGVMKVLSEVKPRDY
jgi:glycosyltransferase involved in cell wall biosynthesis